MIEVFPIGTGLMTSIGAVAVLILVRPSTSVSAALELILFVRVVCDHAPELCVAYSSYV